MSIPDDLLQIETPENVALRYPIAGIGSRFIAALVDTSLIVLLQILVLVLSGLIAQNNIDVTPGALLRHGLAPWILAAFGLLSFLFLWGYYIFFELLWNGQSPGKRIAKLRVMRTDGTPISLTESIIRNLIRVVDFLPALYGVGVVSMFIDSRSRRLGDLAAGTLVVREASARIDLGSLGPGRNSRAGEAPVFDWLDRLPVDRLSPSDLELIDSYLKRRSQFTNAEILGAQILERLFQRMEFPPPAIHRWEIPRLLSQIRAAARRDAGL